MWANTDTAQFQDCQVFQLISGRGVNRGETQEKPSGGPRPSIGVALSGGAARGWAHIGVMQALAEAGYVPDVIAGTSIGAVVGGCYAAGKLDALEEFARSLNRRRMFRLMDFDFRGSGLITGNRLADLLDRQIGGTEIETVFPRVVCVATEL
ncbi:MAG: patatin-like phospholipase family protein, partial [Candidatus Competibacteraceae bacterium]|nr:patatin-like phospholipase family protein [Candidatus Competibacteraceae bacterium]